MSKLQSIKRKNGSLVYSVNIPLEFIENLMWIKGQELNLEDVDGKIVISKVEDEKEEIDDGTNIETGIQPSED